MWATGRNGHLYIPYVRGKSCLKLPFPFKEYGRYSTPLYLTGISKRGGPMVGPPPLLPPL